MWAGIALAYDLVVIVAAAAVVYYGYVGAFRDGVLTKAAYVLSLGAVGGALMSMRYIVYAVRHSSYDARRLPWQVLTPIMSAILAGLGTIAVHAGLLTVSMEWRAKEPVYTLFMMGFSIFIGIASESFIKRLIASAEVLFGERTRITHMEPIDED